MNKWTSVIFGILACLAFMAHNVQTAFIFDSLISSAAEAANTAANTASNVASNVASNAASSLTGTSTDKTGSKNYADVAVGAATDMNTAAQNMASQMVDDGMAFSNAFKKIIASWGNWGIRTTTKVAANEAASTIAAVVPV